MSAGTEMIVAPATDADIGDIVSLVNSAYRGEGVQAGWTNEIGLLDRSGDGCRASCDGNRHHPADA
jgi:hypothetical protein